MQIAVKQFIERHILIIVMLVVVGISVPYVYDSIVRMHSTVFLGLDVAGESLREFTKPGSRIFLRTFSQGWGIGRYARRHVGWTDDLDDFKRNEKKFNIQYVCFYPAEYSRLLQTENEPLFNYIRDNYRFKELGMSEEPRKLYYLILEKGEGSDPENFLMSFTGPRQLRTIYRMLGRYVFFYSIRPEPESEEQGIRPQVTKEGEDIVPKNAQDVGEKQQVL